MIFHFFPLPWPFNQLSLVTSVLFSAQLINGAGPALNGQQCQSCPKVSLIKDTCLGQWLVLPLRDTLFESTCSNKAEKDHFIFPPVILLEERAHIPIWQEARAYYPTLFKERQTPNYKLNTLRATLLLMHYLLNICFALWLKAGHYFSPDFGTIWGSVKVSKPICFSLLLAAVQKRYIKCLSSDFWLGHEDADLSQQWQCPRPESGSESQAATCLSPELAPSPFH